MKEQDLKQFFNSSNLMFCVASTEGFFTQLNDSWTKALGWTEEELKSKPFIEFVHPDDIEKTAAEASRLTTSKGDCVNFINRYITKNGGYKTLSWNSRIIEDSYYCVVQDITKEAKRKEAIEKTSETAKIGSWEVDLMESTVTWSKETYKIHGYTEEFPEQNLEDGINFYHPKFRPMVEDCVNTAIQKGTGWNFEAQIITVTGKKKWVQAIGFVEINSKGVPIRLYGTFQDIDDKKTSKDLFEEKASLLNFALSNSQMGIWNFFPSSRSLKFDNFWCKTTGLHWCSDPIEYDIIEDRLVEESKNNFKENINKLIKKEIDELDIEIQIKCANKEKKYIHLQGKFGGQVGQRKFIGIYQDITDKVLQQKNAEKKKLQMIHASKMTTLGEMAGGVSHEINNPLTVINQVFSVLEKDGTGETSTKTTKIGRKAVNRIADIVQNLKDFSSEKDSALTTEKLKNIIDKALSLHQTKLKHSNIEVINHVPENLEVLCSPRDLSQSIFHIVHNSIFSLKNSLEKKIYLSATKNNDQVILKISDTGAGISPDLKTKVFEPFFTTKDFGSGENSGSGLGLSSAKGLIESFEGKLELSNPSKAEFTLSLKAQ